MPRQPRRPPVGAGNDALMARRLHRWAEEPRRGRRLPGPGRRRGFPPNQEACAPRSWRWPRRSRSQIALRRRAARACPAPASCGRAWRDRRGRRQLRAQLPPHGLALGATRPALAVLAASSDPAACSKDRELTLPPSETMSPTSGRGDDRRAPNSSRAFVRPRRRQIGAADGPWRQASSAGWRSRAARSDGASTSRGGGAPIACGSVLGPPVSPAFAHGASSSARRSPAPPQPVRFKAAAGRRPAATCAGAASCSGQGRLDLIQGRELRWAYRGRPRPEPRRGGHYALQQPARTRLRRYQRSPARAWRASRRWGRPASRRAWPWSCLRPNRRRARDGKVVEAEPKFRSADGPPPAAARAAATSAWPQARARRRRAAAPLGR